ncbi:hypothetical protein Bcep18194_C7520 [Burkholderia lata]|uniref:Uncharacterized protein n=1 Tax=Burkholderia lata (strain ATCC 17760 / DSM 23089 / LMG 22485 / NCIMB 9086 / R18194 / 383) TaxID=482957 RepID=Q39LV2_BURL3|nr:hypothetical protein Bcep18194_C7520 [Burkholderia lata]
MHAGMAREPDSGATEVPQQRMNAVNDPAAFARIATVFGTARGHATRVDVAQRRHHDRHGPLVVCAAGGHAIRASMKSWRSAVVIA